MAACGVPRRWRQFGMLKGLLEENLAWAREAFNQNAAPAVKM